MKENLSENNLVAARNSFITLIGLSVVIGILYFAQAVLIPVIMAIMLSFLLTPIVINFQRYGLHRVIAIITTVIIAFSIIAAIAWSISVQVISLAQQIPHYEETLRTKIRQINDSQQTSGPLSRAGDLFSNLFDEFKNEQPQGMANNSDEKKVVEPVVVEIKPVKKNVIESAAQIIGSYLGTLGTIGLTAIFVIAILFQREDLRDRFIRIISGGGLNVATEALNDAAKRVFRYLFMQLMVNASYGIPIGIGLYFIGVPNAILWGFLAILLRFIPYLGPWIAASFPLGLAFAIDPGWSMLFWTLGLFITLEIISNNVIEPWLYGVSTGTSNFALMFAAVFWTWLWGPVGLFLSTPLTVCVVVLGNYVPSLNFFSVLLGSAPALKPSERLYQRMLAMDYNEMLILSQDFLKDHSLLEYYDQLLIPALNAAESDRLTGGLAEIRQNFILQSILELIEELGVQNKQDQPQTLELASLNRVLIVPAKDDIDELAAKILARSLEYNGITSILHSATSLQTECAELVAKEHIEVICISAVPPAAFISARQLIRRLNTTSCAGIKCVVGVWSLTAQANELQRRLSKNSNIGVVTTMQDAVANIQTLLTIPEDAPMMVAPIPDDENERLKEVYRLQLISNDPNEAFDNVTRALAKAFDVPISLVSIIDTDRQFWKSHIGLPEDLAMDREAPRGTSVCGHVVAGNRALVIEDIAKDKRFANNPFLKSRGIRFYAGAPLRSQSGYAVGSLCIIDIKPRKISERELSLISVMADRLMESVEGVAS